MPTLPSPPVDRLRALPKAEVHALLEGCYESSALEQWAAQARVIVPRHRERLCKFEGRADFLHFLARACGLASLPERLTELEPAALGAHQRARPLRVLKDVAERMPTQTASRIDELLPHRWPVVP